MAKFEYRGANRTTEDISRRAKQSGGSYDSYLLPDIQFYKPVTGENAVRILPPTWKDEKKWGNGWEIQVYLHRNVGPDNGTYLCLDKMLGEPCPVCAARREAADEDEADALKPQWRGLCWVIDRNAEKAGPQVWGLPITLFREINLRSVDKKTQAAVLIDDPEEGYDLLFTREGQQKKTKYVSVEVDRDPTPVHDNEKTQDRWLDYISENPLPDALNYFEAEHIEQVLFGRGRDEPEDKPAPRRTRGGKRDEAPEEEDTGRRRRRAEPEAEPDEQEERAPPRRSRQSEPEPEEESDEPKTRPTGRRGRKAPEPEPEAEDDPPPRRGRRSEPEPEEDAEEDPPPRRGRAGGRSGGATEEDEAPSQQARRQLSRLKGRASK